MPSFIADQLSLDTLLPNLLEIDNVNITYYKGNSSGYEAIIIALNTVIRITIDSKDLFAHIIIEVNDKKITASGFKKSDARIIAEILKCKNENIVIEQNMSEMPSGADFVHIEGGTFQMGSDSEDDEKPVHTVTVKSFSIAKYLVTQKDWYEVMGNHPGYFKGDDRPVENVNWFDVIAYCNKRSLQEGLNPVYSRLDDDIICDWNANGYRLPTEAEWEYASKSSDSEEFEYSGSNNVDSVGWHTGNSSGETHAVGVKAPNGIGLYDMSGNVWEWCWDWYGSYSSEKLEDPVGSVSGSFRVRRGGSWNNSEQSLRLVYRGNHAPTSRSSSVGFRVVRS